MRGFLSPPNGIVSCDWQEALGLAHPEKPQFLLITGYMDTPEELQDQVPNQAIRTQPRTVLALEKWRQTPDLADRTDGKGTFGVLCQPFTVDHSSNTVPSGSLS